MGSAAHVALVGGRRSLLGLARARLDELERRWSRFLPESEISQLNRSTGQPIVVDRTTYDVVAAAVEAWRWSGGRYDPTVGTTMARAGYDRPFAELTARTSPGDVDHLACPTPAGIELDPYPGSIAVPDGVELDLGGIGKGAAADLLARELLAGGADGCCVNIGGDLRVAGTPPRPSGWAVEIEPGPGIEPVTIGVVDGAVCTSTRSRRAWIGSLGPEHHLRDPTTGRPLSTGLTTVSVVGANATQSEVLTKCAFGAGPTEAASIITGADATGLLVTDEGRVVELDGLAPFVAAVRPAPAPTRAESGPAPATVGQSA